MKNVVQSLLFFIFIFLFLFMFMSHRYNYYNRNIEKYIICKWSGISISYDLSRKNICQKYMKIIDSLNIYYFLGHGSQLGALRNGGLIKGDKDIDIIVPVSRNYKLFKCKEEIKITNNYFNDKYTLMTANTLLCKHNRSYYSRIFQKYIIHNLKNYNIKKTKITPDNEVVKLFIYDGLYVDFYINIANEYVYRDYNLCKCLFCDLYTLSSVNAAKYSKILYGDSYLTEMKYKTKLKYYHINITLIK